MRHAEIFQDKNGRDMERTKIVYAAHLPPCADCGEPLCPEHGLHYADCDCVGPNNYEEEGWTLEGSSSPEYVTRPVRTPQT